MYWEIKMKCIILIKGIKCLMENGKTKYNLVQILFCLIFCNVFHLNYLIVTKKEHRNLNKFLLDRSIFLVGV